MHFGFPDGRTDDDGGSHDASRPAYDGDPSAGLS